MSLHRYPSEFLTRQSFDVRALTSPPFALSQHLSRSRAVPDRYRQCAFDSATKYEIKKKPLRQTPVRTHPSFGRTAPHSGSEFDLTAFACTGSHALQVNYNHKQILLVKSFFGVKGRIELSLTDSQAVVLPLHYRHHKVAVVFGIEPNSFSVNSRAHTPCLLYHNGIGSISMMIGLCGRDRTYDLVCPRHARYHCATHRDRGSWERCVHDWMNYIHEMAVMYIFLSFVNMTLLFLGGSYLRRVRLTVEPSAYASCWWPQMGNCGLNHSPDHRICHQHNWRLKGSWRRAVKHQVVSHANPHVCWR